MKEGKYTGERRRKECNKMRYKEEAIVRECEIKNDCLRS